MNDDRVWIGNFTDGQQAVVRRALEDLRRAGVHLRASFTHRRHHVVLGGTAEEIGKLEATLRAYGHDDGIDDALRRFARRAAEKVATRLREHAAAVREASTASAPGLEAPVDDRRQGENP